VIDYYSGQHRQIAEIFYDAIHNAASACYEPEQIAAWAPLPVNYERWKWRCELKRPFVYLVDDKVVGFIELDSDGHIDCHYVRSDYARRGIGGMLLEHVLQIGDELQLPRLYVEASHLAKGLYLKHGFEVVRPNVVERNGVQLDNWIMERQYPHPNPKRQGGNCVVRPR